MTKKYNRHFTFIVLFLAFVFTAHAQPPQKTDTITVWMASISKMKDDTNKVKELLVVSHYCTYNDPMRGIQVANQTLKLAEKLNWERGIYRSYSAIAKQYGIMNIYPTALENFNKALSLAEKANDKKSVSTYLNNIGLLYSYAGELDKALEYFQKQSAYNKKTGIRETNYDLLNYGNLYFSKKDFPRALDYFQRALERAIEEKIADENITRIHLNIAGVYSEQKEYGKALKYFSEAEQMALKYGDKFSLALIYYNVGHTYVVIYSDKNTNGMPDSLKDQARNMENALFYLNKCLAVSREIHSQESIQRVCFDLAKVYEDKGNDRQALYYRKAYELVTDSLRDVGKQKEFARVEAEFKVHRTTDSLKYIAGLKEKEVRQHKLERNIYVLLISFAGIITVLLINRQKLKHKQKRMVAEELAKHQLEDFTKSIHEKNELIEKFSAEIERYQSLPCSNELPEKESSLQALLHSVILTEDQWVNFQSLFDKVHTGYITRAKNKFKGLTPAELRFLVLSKLGLSYKAMAGILGVSTEAVRISKYRLLKKIQLPEGADFEELVHSI